jgi:hypothetical protein
MLTFTETDSQVFPTLHNCYLELDNSFVRGSSVHWGIFTAILLHHMPVVLHPLIPLVVTIKNVFRRQNTATWEQLLIGTQIKFVQ